MKNFWDHTHPLSAQSDDLYETLVPAMFNCDTVQGEMLRASSKIGYDWYNNGWGCNNWSGAVAFLKQHIGTFDQKRAEEERSAFTKALDTAQYYSCGAPVSISDDVADEVVTTIHAYVVQCVLDHPVAVPNTEDMYSLQKRDYEHYDEDDFWDDEEDDR